MSETKTIDLKSQFDVNRKDFLQFCEAVSALSESATITLTKDADSWGMSCKTMDPSHVSLVDAYLSFNKKVMGMTVEQFAVRIDELKKVVKTMKAESITITIDIKNDIETIELSSDDQSTELSMIDKTEVEQVLPKITWEFRGLFDTKEFLAMLRSVELVSDYITFTATDDGISYSAKGDNGKTSGVLKKDPVSDRIVSQGLVNGKIEGTYSLEYLLPMFRVLKDGNVILALSSNKPCLITYDNAEDRKSDDIFKRIKYFLAPRVGD